MQRRSEFDISSCISFEAQEVSVTYPEYPLQNSFVSFNIEVCGKVAGLSRIWLKTLFVLNMVVVTSG
jgi:hypothetical protein